MFSRKLLYTRPLLWYAKLQVAYKHGNIMTLVVMRPELIKVR